MFRFGPAGIPLECEGTSIDGVRCTASLGLDAMELEFVHGCRMKKENAEEIGAEAKKLDISLSAHGSYYLNLLSPEKQKLGRTKAELAKTAETLHLAGGKRLVFHAGFYLGMEKSKAYELMKKNMNALLEKTKDFDVFLAPEVMGKESQFGSLEEVFGLAGDLGYDKVRPCIDWGHYHARNRGVLKEKKDFARVLELVEKKAGKEGLKTLHCHVSGIEFTEKGERRHLPLSSKQPDFILLLEALKEFKCSGTLICESPLIEKDALLLKETWEGL
ncbi:TIM barrel protein [Candidatus Micrarchaeota archaeon]|nr:TIM barrel protein [Candidatus Micrarchaeota archaeon]